MRAQRTVRSATNLVRSPAYTLAAEARAADGKTPASDARWSLLPRQLM